MAGPPQRLMVAEPLDALDESIGGVSMRKIIAVGLLVAAMASGTALAATDLAQVTATFSIPSWIALAVIGNGDVAFGEIAGGGAYVGNNETSLRVISTASWTLSNEILWDDPLTSIPDGASQAIIEAALARNMSSNGGAWGLHFITVDYEFTVTDEELASLPVGDYGLVIRYTATTD